MAAAVASIDELDVLINNAGILVPTAADPARRDGQSRGHDGPAPAQPAHTH